MKHNLIKTLLLVSVIAVMGQLVLAQAPPVVFAPTYQDLDTSGITHYFEVDAIPLTRPEAEAIANRILNYLGIAADYAVSEDASDETKLVYGHITDPSGTLEIDLLTEEIMFCKGMSVYDVEEDTPDLPSEMDAPVIAQSHLAALQLMPADPLYLQHVGKLCMSTVDENENTYDYDKLRTVIYGRKMDDIPVTGAARIFAGLGTAGELVSLSWCWAGAQAISVQPQDILDPLDIRLRITEQLQAAYPDAVMITVKENRLSMYDDGNGIIEPAAILLADVDDGMSDPYEIDWATSILMNPGAYYAFLDQQTQPDPDNDPPGDPNDD